MSSVNNKSRFQIDMCVGPILPKLLRFALPLMATNLLQLMFAAADSVVVGLFAGEDSLAAVGATVSLINLITNLFLGLSVGVNVVAARCFGAKNDEELSQTTHTSIFISAIIGLIMTAVGVIGAEHRRNGSGISAGTAGGIDTHYTPGTEKENYSVLSKT